MLEIGSLIDGKYKILNEVGQGSMGVVYMAINEKANKTWAVKEVRKDGVLNFEAVKQGLVAETNILKKLSHPSLPSIIDVIDTEDTFLIIMDYVQGNSLNKALEEYGAQPQESSLSGQELCVCWVPPLPAAAHHLPGHEARQYHAQAGWQRDPHRLRHGQRVQGEESCGYHLSRHCGLCGPGAVRWHGSDGCPHGYLLSGCYAVPFGHRLQPQRTAL